MLLRSRRTKDGGIIREMSLSMRVPIVSPTNDVFFCRELPLFEWWEKSPEGKEGANIILKYAMYSLVEKELLYKIFIFAHASSKGGVIWKTKTLSKELPNSAI